MLFVIQFCLLVLQGLDGHIGNGVTKSTANESSLDLVAIPKVRQIFTSGNLSGTLDCCGKQVLGVLLTESGSNGFTVDSLSGKIGADTIRTISAVHSG